MPRAGDIAWKFVIRLEGKKWRCPYCKNEYSGSVARVKSHLLKQPKEGVAPCTKVPESISTLVELLHNQVHNKDDIAWKLVNRLGENKWHCHHCREEFFGDLTGVKGHLLGVPNERISICMEVPDHVRTLMRSLLNEVAEEESREANGQSSMEPQSRHMPAQADVAEEESRDANTQFFTEPQRPLFSREILSPDSLEQWLQSTTMTDIGVNSDQQPQPERQFHQSSTMPLFVQSSHETVHMCVSQQPSCHWQAGSDTTAIRPHHHLVPPPSEESLDDQGESISHSMMALPEVESYRLDLPDQSQCSIRSQMQMNDQQTSAGASASQYDQIRALGNSNCLLDGSQHSQLQIPMDIDPSIASQHTIDSQVIEATIVDLQVLEVATNTTGPSSSQDMNRGSPIMNVRSIYASNAEIRNLKRKLEELNNKEAVIMEQMEIESAASSVRKKPRILVERWLKETERARDNFQLANAEILPAKEQVETWTREVEELIEETLPQTLLIEERDAKGVKFLERNLTGEAIHRNIELIWEFLKENHACKLGIYGMGGVGKTTIMMHIHNRLLKDATFDGVVFITVSKDFNIYKLQCNIWKALKFAVMEDEHEKKRAAMLAEHLERKKNCVLILDDVWGHLDLEEMGIPVRANGLKLVLTTRFSDVCCQMQCQKMIKINPLSQEEAESLFLEEFGREVTLNLEIEPIVKSIVRECAGLPIGVITIARSMRGVTTVFAWRDLLVKLQESSMEQTDMEKKVLMNLKFSYDHLGNPYVQQCFLSCALYPEDEFIDKFELVEFFIDQGLIGGLNMRKEQYDRGLTILNKLGNVCLLEDCGRWMKMHDLIRDMALHIMSTTSIVKAGKKLRRIPSEEYWTDALEKVSLMKNDISEFPLNMSPNCPRLITLLLNGCLLSSVPDSFLKNLLGLKVLNLSGCHLRELPNSISNLVDLRALLLRKCKKLDRIPYLGMLTSLRKLDVSGCESLEALEGLEKLMNLRYLDLIKTRIERLPNGTLDRLPSLQFLKVWAVNEQDFTKLGALETFRCCPVNADDFNKCVRIIEQSNNPRYYNLYVDLEKSKFVVELSDNAGFGIPKRSVHIRELDRAILSVEGECTGIFILIPQDVWTMKMRKCDGITNLYGMGPFECLDKLEIEEWENLGVLCGEHDEERIAILDSAAPTPTPLLFPNLRVLEIERCPKLKYLFGHGSKFNLPLLREIHIRGCKEMVGIIASVTSPPPHAHPFFPSLEEILVDSCDKMVRAVESEWIPHFPNLRSITVL